MKVEKINVMIIIKMWNNRHYGGYDRLKELKIINDRKLVNLKNYEILFKNVTWHLYIDTIKNLRGQDYENNN